MKVWIGPTRLGLYVTQLKDHGSSVLNQHFHAAEHRNLLLCPSEIILRYAASIESLMVLSCDPSARQHPTTTQDKSMLTSISAQRS